MNRRYSKLVLPRLLVLAVLVSGCARSMMATPQLYRNTMTPVFGELAPELQGDRLNILFVTDRMRATLSADGNRFYGSGRSPSAALGVAGVEIGPGAGSWETSVQPEGESGEFTILHLKQFLRILAHIPEIEKIHIGAGAQRR